MVEKRRVGRWALVLVALVVSSVLGSATAMASDLDDYRWERRPLLVFAPSNDDPKLVETLSRIAATRCQFDDRDMMLGVLVAEGNSTLDGQAIDADESRRLATRFGIGANDFSVRLIGKDGGEKWRVDAVPELRTIYAVIDGMPMRSRDKGADPGAC